MTPVAQEPTPHVEQRSDRVAKRQIRGSALLMAGRGISVALNFATQILIVRALSKSDYGAFAYGLSMVSMATSFAVFGMDKTASRWVTTYHEQRDDGKLFGSLLLMTGTILALGLGVILTVFGLRGYLGSHVVSSPLSLAMLLSLIVLTPVNALDNLLQSMFAVFSSARLIFFRRHVVGPGLKLAAVLAVMAAGGSVHTLATAYVVAGLLGLAIGLGLFVRVMHDRGLWARFDLAALRIPARQIFGFSLPMLNADLVYTLRFSMVVFFLDFFHDGTGVADYRAVVPVARLNRVVLESFSFMFMPAIARLAARGDVRGVDDVHWRSTGWIAMLSFPVFAVSFAMARPVTVLLLGESYAESSYILALLSLGYFFHATMGLNKYTLRVCGKIRHILAVDFVAILIALLLNLVLIPLYGATGAGIAVCLGMIAHALVNQVVLATTTGVQLFPRRYLGISIFSAAGALALLLVQRVWAPPLVVGVVLAAILWAGLSLLSRRLLAVNETFPELLRIPFVRRLFDRPARPTGGDAERP